MAIERLVGHFEAVRDPRCGGKIEHRLTDILVIAVCAVIACAESWNDIALYGRSKLAWLGTFLALPNGIPSHDTFRRVFILIDPEAFEAGFTAWAGSLAAGFEREVVAIDGKTLRRSFDHKHEHAPLHLVIRNPGDQFGFLGLGHQWKSVCGLMVAASRRRQRSAMVASRSASVAKCRLTMGSSTSGQRRSAGWSSGL